MNEKRIDFPFPCSIQRTKRDLKVEQLDNIQLPFPGQLSVTHMHFIEPQIHQRIIGFHATRPLQIP